MRYLDPIAARQTDAPLSAARHSRTALTSLSGKTVALISNNNPSMAKIHARIAQRLQSEFGVSVIRSYQVPRNFAPPAGSLEQIARECDAAVFGLAN